MAGDVEIVKRNGASRLRGVARCGSVWECPACSLAIRTRRAEEVSRAIEWHGRNNTQLLTLTVRHGIGSDLESIRKGVARAWRQMQTGAPWKRFKGQVGLIGSIRACEITYGPNGFHPHLHVLLLTRDLSNDEIECARVSLSVRWQSIVARVLGSEHVPNDRNGCDLRRCHGEDYIAKLGLELVASNTKAGRAEHRTPFQVLNDFFRDGDQNDLDIWRVYCVGIKGARMLTWSRGLRAAAGLLPEQTDEEIVAEEEAALAEVVAVIPGAVWDRIRRVAGATARILTTADSGDGQAVALCLGELLHQARCAEAKTLPPSSRNEALLRHA